MQEWDQGEAGSSVRARGRIDVRFQRLLAQAALDLCEPWRIRCGSDKEEERQKWQERRGVHAKEAKALLDKYAAWAINAANTPNKTNARSILGRRELWWRQQRAVVALLEMEVAFCQLGYAWFKATAELAESLTRERREILAEARETLQWIEGGAVAGNVIPLDLASPQERLRSWARTIETEAARLLPERVELVIPGLYPRWRQVAAREAFQTAFSTYAVEPMSHIVEDYWSGSAKIVREASRAREIIDYWREASSTNTGATSEASKLFSDALHNAAAMFSHQLQTTDAAEELDAKVADAFQVWAVEGSAALEAAQFGWAIVQRPRGRTLLRAVVRLQEQKARTKGRRGVRWIADRWEATLESFGAKIPARPALQPVVRRTTLRDTLSLPASRRELPEIYRLLFRLGASRRSTLSDWSGAGTRRLEQALKDWEAGSFCGLPGRGSAR